MKLITEVIDTVQVICETKGGEKQYFIEGIFMQEGIANRNRRRYPEGLLESEVTRYNKDYIDRGRALGELGHPEGPTINLERVSHKIVSLRKEGLNYFGKAMLLPTPYGQIAKSFVQSGVQLGVSSRGMGSLREGRDGIQDVQNDFYLATPADIVLDPSAPEAFVQGIMEGKEWVWDNGIVKEVNIEAYKREIQKATHKRLEEAKLKVFEDFLKSLQK